MRISNAGRTAVAPLTGLALALALLAGFSAPTNADTKDDIRRQQDKVNSKIKQAEKDVKRSAKRFEDAKNQLLAAEGQLKSAQSKLSGIRGQLVVAQAENRRMQKSLARAENNLKKAERNFTAAEKALKASESEIEVFTVETVLQGDAGLRAFGELIKGQDPMVFSEQMSIRDSISESQIAQMQVLAASRVLLDVERQRVQDLRDDVAAKKEQAEENLRTVENLKAQAEEQAAQVESLVGERSKAKKSANAALAEDMRMQALLEAESAALASRLQRIIDEELRKAGGGTGGSGGTKAPPTGDSGAALSRPVAGPITSPYGMRLHPITKVYKLHDGTDFGSPCGTPIRAAAGGTIVEQYYNAAYGNRVILNNGIKRGVSVVTTYNHLSRFAVSTGSKVTRGQVIGYVGTTGYSTGCHLHFMVLVNGKTVDPMSWL